MAVPSSHLSRRSLNSNEMSFLSRTCADKWKSKDCRIRSGSTSQPLRVCDSFEASTRKRKPDDLFHETDGQHSKIKVRYESTGPTSLLLL